MRRKIFANRFLRLAAFCGVLLLLEAFLVNVVPAGSILPFLAVLVVAFCFLGYATAVMKRRASQAPKAYAFLKKAFSITGCLLLTSLGFLLLLGVLMAGG